MAGSESIKNIHFSKGTERGKMKEKAVRVKLYFQAQKKAKWNNGVYIRAVYS
jgi:hypothetical protein